MELHISTEKKYLALAVNQGREASLLSPLWAVCFEFISENSGVMWNYALLRLICKLNR